MSSFSIPRPVRAPPRHRGRYRLSRVQSTPLIEWDGRLLGVVSTHYPRPYSLSACDLEIIKRYGELAGQIMADHLGDRSHQGMTSLSVMPSHQVRSLATSSPLLDATGTHPPIPGA